MKKKLLLATLVVSLPVLTLIYMSPWHMDEFVMFHRYGCGQPAQALYADWPGSNCDNQDLPFSILGLTYNRSYPYIGILSSVIIAPVASIYDSPSASILFGLLTLLLFAWLIAKAANLAAHYSLLVFLFFPVTYSILHDSGPIRLSILAIPILLIASRQLYSHVNLRSVCVAAFSVSTCLLALEDKPFFAYLLPGSFVLALALIPDFSFSLRNRKSLTLLVFFFSLFLTQIAFLVLGRVPGQHAGAQSYFSYLAQSGPSLEMRLSNLSEAIKYIVSWPYYASRVYSLNGSLSVTFIIASLALILILYRMRSSIVQAAGPHFFPCIFLSYLFYLAAACIAGGKFGHHFVYSQIPVVVLMMIFVREARFPAAVFVVLTLSFLQVSTLMDLSRAPTHSYTSNHLQETVPQVIDAMGPSDVLSCGSWGCYYGYSFGGNKGRSVVSAESSRDISTLLLFSSRAGGSVYHVCNSNICSVDQLSRVPGVSTVDQLDLYNSMWKAFRLR